MTDYTFSPLDYYDKSGARRTDHGDTFDPQLPLKYYFEVNNLGQSENKNDFSVLVVTDGTCGSTCSTFLNHAVEIGAVTTIGVGGFDVFDRPNSDPNLAASSFAGGSVLDSKTFEQIWDEMHVTNKADPKIPPRMPRDNYIRFPYNALMSFRDKEVALEFQQLMVSYQVPYFAAPGSDLSSADAIREMLDAVVPRIYPRDKQTNSPVNTKNNYLLVTKSEFPSGNLIPHARYGRFYDPKRKAFEADPKPIGCEEGFYPEYQKGTGGTFIPLMDREITGCAQLQETKFTTNNTPKKPVALEVVAIVFIVLAVAVCVLVLVFWFIRTRQGKRFGDVGCDEWGCCGRGRRSGELESDEMLGDGLDGMEVSSSSSDRDGSSGR